jgi:hypothetical protein
MALTSRQIAFRILYVICGLALFVLACAAWSWNTFVGAFFGCCFIGWVAPLALVVNERRQRTSADLS